MRKLEKREKIIVGVMGIAILYGAFNFLFTTLHSKTPVQASASATLQALTDSVAALTSKDSQSALDAYIIMLAEKEWQDDPFLKRTDYRTMFLRAEAPKVGVMPPKANAATYKADGGLLPKLEASLPPAAFNYTGYMEFGGKQIAIINGAEYTLGEELGKSGYILKSISPTKVDIENGRSKLQISIQE